MVGKYTGFSDAYLSVIKSLHYAAVYCDRKVEIVWVEAEDLEDQTRKLKPQVFETAWNNVSILVTMHFVIKLLGRL